MEDAIAEHAVARHAVARVDIAQRELLGAQPHVVGQRCRGAAVRVEVHADQLRRRYFVARLAVVHAVHEADRRTAECQQLGRHVQQLAGEHFALISRALVDGDRAPAVLLEEGRREAESAEELPGGLVEARRVVLHVHVPDVVDVPRVHGAAVGLDRLVHERLRKKTRATYEPAAASREPPNGRNGPRQKSGCAVTARG